MGRRARRRRAAGRLGRRRHQGGAADRRPDAQRLRVARHRRQDFPNPAFAQDNRGKRSVVLDLRQPEAREQLEELLATADVFLTNLRPDALDGLGLEPEATVARHPRLVYCSVSGYGLRGEDRNRPAYDIGAFWARSGLSVQLANSEGVPLNARGGIGDHISGLAALAGLLAAVLEQRQTGRGRVVEVSLLRTGTYVLGLGPQPAGEPGQGGQGRGAARQPDAADELVPDQGRALVLLHRPRGRPPHRHGLPGPRPRRTCTTTHASPTPGRCARTASRSSPCSTTSSDRAPSTSGPSASTARACGGHRPRGRPRCSRTRSSPANDGVPRAARARRTGPTQRSVNGPVSFSDLPVRPAAPAPLLGEHTDEVLAELAADGRARRLRPDRAPGPAGPGR